MASSLMNGRIRPIPPAKTPAYLHPNHANSPELHPPNPPSRQLEHRDSGNNATAVVSGSSAILSPTDREAPVDAANRGGASDGLEGNAARPTSTNVSNTQSPLVFRTCHRCSTRQRPEEVKVGPSLSTLPVTLPKGTLSILGSGELSNNGPCSRVNPSDATDAQQSVNVVNVANVANLSNSVDISKEGETVIDHCWWTFSIYGEPELKNQQQAQFHHKGDQHRKSSCPNNLENQSISILAVLKRCTSWSEEGSDNVRQGRVGGISSSCSRVDLYFYARNLADVNSDNERSKFVGEGHGDVEEVQCDHSDGSAIKQRSRLHRIASISIPHHATAIAMGGPSAFRPGSGLQSINGILVVARSSGIELHSLQPFLSQFVLEHCMNCGVILQSEACESALSSGETQSNSFKQTMQQSEVESPQSVNLSSHPVHYGLQVIQLLQSFVIHALHLSYPYLAVASGDRLGVWNVNHNHLFTADGNLNSCTQDQGDEQSGTNNPNQRVNNFNASEALWTAILPPYSPPPNSSSSTASSTSNIGSVHRRVTSIHMTMQGGAIALSCWDGSAFVYLASDSKTDHCSINSQTSSGSSFDAYSISSWELVNAGGFAASSALCSSPSPSSKRSFSFNATTASRISPPWERPTIQSSSDGLFPTFVLLGSNRVSKNHQRKLACLNDISGTDVDWRGLPGSLLLVVSTPGTDRIRCFDVFHTTSCPDVCIDQNDRMDSRKVGLRTKQPGFCLDHQTHGMATVVNSDLEDELVWVTGKDVISSKKWSMIHCGKAPNGTDCMNSSYIFRTLSWVKRRPAKIVIAESSSSSYSNPLSQSSLDGKFDMHDSTISRVLSKAWLYWHDPERKSPLVANDFDNHACVQTSDTAFPAQHSSCWMVLCEWNMHDCEHITASTSEKRNAMSFSPAPFLTESDVLDLLQQDETEITDQCNDSLQSSKTRALISSKFFVVVVPSYEMVYVYGRAHSTVGWTVIDLQNDQEGRSMLHVLKAVIINSCLLVLLSESCLGSLVVEVWNLNSLFVGRPPLSTPVRYSIQLPNQEMHAKSFNSYFSELIVQPVIGKSMSFVVLGLKHTRPAGMWVWEVNCNEDLRSVSDSPVLTSDICLSGGHFISIPNNFATKKSFAFHECFYLSSMKDHCAKHLHVCHTGSWIDGLSAPHNEIVLSFHQCGIDWLVLPRVNLWRPTYLNLVRTLSF